MPAGRLYGRAGDMADELPGFTAQVCVAMTSRCYCAQKVSPKRP